MARGKCRACGRHIPPSEPRYRFMRIEGFRAGDGDRGKTSSVVCDKCGKASEKAWDKARESASTNSQERKQP